MELLRLPENKLMGRTKNWGQCSALRPLCLSAADGATGKLWMRNYGGFRLIKLVWKSFSARKAIAFRVRKIRVGL